MKKNGFTLIELLVAISIMAILSAIAVVTYSGITTKARDSQRIKDLQAIKQGLELYKADIHNYPTSESFVVSTSTQLTNCTGSQDASCVPTVTYFQQIPRDSNSSHNYFYKAMTTSNTQCYNTSVSTACMNFVLCAKKEGTDTSYDLANCSLFSCGSGINCDIGVFSQ